MRKNNGKVTFVQGLAQLSYEQKKPCSLAEINLFQMRPLTGRTRPANLANYFVLRIF